MQRTFKNRNDFNSSMSTIMSWSLIVIVLMVLQQQIKTTDAVKFKGDACSSKNEPGICREWSECPILKTLIENGQYTKREIVNCGFGVREEIICCPEVTTTVTEPTNRFEEPATTTKSLARDFWLDLLENTNSTIETTTEKRDFWLDLLTTPTRSQPTTTTTTTTVKPLIVGDQRLNESSEFFDFNALLSSDGSNHDKLVVTTVRSITNHNSNNNGFVVSGNNNNGHGNLNSGPVNLNQWIFDDSGNQGTNNNFRGNGNNARGHGNGWVQNSGRGHGNGWAQNNGRGEANVWSQNNGHGQGSVRGQNNGRGRPGMGNQNHGFVFPEKNRRPDQFFETDDRRPGRPVNIMAEQNPNSNNVNPQPSSSQRPTIPNQTKDDNKQEEENVEDLIKNVFHTSSNNNKLTQVSGTTQNEVEETNVAEVIANVFNLKPQQHHTDDSGQVATSSNTAPVVWLSPQSTTEKPVEYIQQQQLPQHQLQPQPPIQQMAFQNPHQAGQFEIFPTVEHQINGNNLDVAPSTSFIQQPVVVETWANNPVHQNQFDPAQVVFENLVNSGMDIIKSNELQHQEQVVVFQPQILGGQQFIPTPAQQPFIQPPQQKQHFFFQQPQHLIQQPTFQQLIEQPPQHQQLPSESLMKEPRSTVVLPNIQSPPAHILDPFKPFEFRPPQAYENLFSEDNNSLSKNSTLSQRDGRDERPAVRACRRIEKGLSAFLSTHILGGTPAELGEFPHMAAIGYSRIGGDDRPPYDIRCGGTLIDKRYVMTAAHCVSELDIVPRIVRLGVVNFNDPDEISQAVELKIKQVFIHDNYTSRLTYNDIAILELERDVATSEYVYPVCLYTNESDPNPKTNLWVTGWGTVNTTTRQYSDILLKVRLHASPLEHCNRSFVDYGLNRKIRDGIISTQLCAEDKDQIKDACQGDSGGPLNLIVDESMKNYRVVGIVSTGIGCASSTPGLYTRVASFLDFIEKIVWPNGGD